MSICSFVVFIIPLDGSITICDHKILSFDGFPSKRGAGIATHSRCIMDCEYFALINIVYFGFTVRASYSNYFIVGVDLN